jgi:hypothetical protein
MRKEYNDKYATDEEIENLIKSADITIKRIDEMYPQVSMPLTSYKVGTYNPNYVSHFFNDFVLISKDVDAKINKSPYIQSFPIYKTFDNKKQFQKWLRDYKPLISSIGEWVFDDTKKISVSYYMGVNLNLFRYNFQFFLNKFNWFKKFEKSIKNFYRVTTYKKPEDLRVIGRMKQFDEWVPIYATGDDFCGDMKNYNIK